ncbi:DNA primase, large subunit [Meira miltonrushii]|uniref:DNA primase large subunit n=1 Tax=Meira miltonrushii TaxID=1280837 RepID=A0A316VH48_9BASI|nr:DNA primase, large subunit [Meira miltonrushii]PWN36574.1 DNA primase, large subunit [Meira miltonrushii]
MFRAAPQAERKAAPIERASGAGYPSVDRYATKGPRRYPFRLNFYREPPVSEVTIEQFETWAIDRLRVLAEIESSQARNRSYTEMKEIVTTQCKKYLPLSATTASGMSGGPDVEAERMKDHISHFVLRLAFCRTEDLRRRFVKAETALFRLRFENDDASEKERFLKTLNFDWEFVTKEERQANREALIAANPRLANFVDSETFYKVPWTRVLDLVEKRKVLLRAGTAWVPMREQASLVVAEFSQRLMKELELTSRALPRLDEDDRILPLLSHLSMGFIAGISREISSNAIQGLEGGNVTAEMVDALIKEHAPLCMRNLHESLQDKGHLRHYGRLQYSLFLKDVGLPVEEALLFWRRSFRAMSDDKFNKDYKYNIRWAYGLEGRRVNAPAKNCISIITQDQPGPQDNHGCPFRHFSPQNLSSALITHYGLNFAEQAEILQAVKAGHYHVGCTRLFEMTHKKQGIKKGDGLGEGESVSHPNRYFERSYSIVQNGGVPAKSETKAEELPSLESKKDDTEMNLDDAAGEHLEKEAETAKSSNEGYEPDEDEEMELLAMQGA